MVGVLDHRDVELTRQAEDRQHRQQRLGPEAGAEGLGLQLLLQLQIGIGLGEQVAQAIEHAPGDIDAQGQEGDQLDQRFEGDRLQQADMVLGGIGVAGAEQDGEQRHDRRDIEGGIAQPGGSRDIAGVGEYLIGTRDGLQLQGDVGQGADQGHQRGEHRQRLRLAVARGDEVGDRGDVLALGDPNHLEQDRPEQQTGQNRPDEDAQITPAAGRGLPDATVEGPAGAVDRKPQTVDRWAPIRRPVFLGVAIPPPCNREQHRDICECHCDQPPTLEHVALLSGSAILRSPATSPKHCA